LQDIVVKDRPYKELIPGQSGKFYVFSANFDPFGGLVESI